ncbi:MAG: alpha-galactosidase [Candidatus Marinimicrobia bacterium]|nr:alpha-galactosidase [Candidatus Neomarinimicrobiota bacterium]
MSKTVIEYDSVQNIFWLKGLWKLPLPFSLSLNYTIDLPLSEIPHQTSSGFKPVHKGWQITTPEIRLTLNWQRVNDGIELVLQLVNRSKSHLKLHNISPAIFDLEDLRKGLSQHFFYQHGFQSWSPSRPRRGDELQQYPRLKSFALMNQNVDSPFWGKPDGMSSSLFTALVPEEDEPALFLGFIEQRQGLGEFYLRNRGLIQLLSFLDYGGKIIESGEEVRTETLLISAGKPLALVNDYMTRLGQNMGARIDTASPVGWCSWYEFYTKISEKKLLSNTHKLDSYPELGVSFVQLDDGYQTAIGDWLSLNKKFPAGLKAVAQEINRRGFKAGIWLAPFMAGRNSRLFREHPDWFLKDDRGKAVDCGFNPQWKTRVAALDLTNPEVENWIESIFKQLVAWGFDYFKIDFIFAGIRHGQRYRPALSPLETYRHGLEIIRKVIEERFLLGCGAPIGPSVGLVDAMRVSEDVLEKWHNHLWEWLGRGCGVPSASGSLRNNIQRSVMHKKLWLNDPDCLLVRDRKTDLNPTEVRTLITLLGMTGGMLFLSDDLTRLNRKRLEWVRGVLPSTSLTGQPDEQFHREFPKIFRITGKSTVLALTNWSSKPEQFDLLLYTGKNNFIFDFWGERFWQVVPARLKPHATLALQVTPKSSLPQVVATNLHLTALADERIARQYESKTGTLKIQAAGLSRTSGKLWIAVPTGFTYLSAMLNDQICNIESWEAGIVIGIEQVQSFEIAVEFLKTD